jgi:hypothetical protein
MNVCALVFRSVHDVLEAERRMKERGMAYRLIPVPKQVNPNCGLALQVDCREVGAVQAVLADLQSRLNGVYTVRGSVFTPLETSP